MKQPYPGYTYIQLVEPVIISYQTETKRSLTSGYAKQTVPIYIERSYASYLDGQLNSQRGWSTDTGRY